jgi:hypothetical protein
VNGEPLSPFDPDVNFDAYQRWALDFAKYSKGSLVYPALKLNGEAQRVAEQFDGYLLPETG